MARPAAGVRGPAVDHLPRAAWYAPSRTGWGSVLHLPYTVWHLSFVLIGAGLAPHLYVSRLVATLIAFGLAVGLAAHCLDELHGRPLGTTIPASHLVGVAAASLAGAVALGAVGIARVGWGLAVFIAAGAVVVVAYNLELWGGRLHNDHTFALAWGSFPLLTAYFAQASTLRPAAVAGALFAYGLGRAQRVLSTEARDLRRRVESVEGERRSRDGAVAAVTKESMLRPLERALIALSWCTCALGVAMVLAAAGH
jgi:asparagine N-glycosylation enzyme membrane subunit Stt3